MATNEKRLDDLERSTGGDDVHYVLVNWRTDDKMLDRDTGEYVTEQEWRKRHPNDRLINLSWGDEDDKEDGYDDAQEPVKA